MPKSKKANPAACGEGCECPCCSATCPYCTLAVLIDQLKAAGVTPDKAAEVAAEFVAAHSCGE